MDYKLNGEEGGMAVANIPVAETAKSIGARLRRIRKANKVTLVELAKSSGVDIATISRIETGKMTGTLESHVRLANALGVKVTNLYQGIEEERTKNAVTQQPVTQRRDVYVHESGASIALLTTNVMAKKLMPVMITVEPGGQTQREEAKVGTERFVYVLEGQIDVHVEDQVYTLGKGSTLYFDASIVHNFRNTEMRVAKCLSVMTPAKL